jgi:signal-transduction protein with cAMP-binding, CBS, and nucleotidyltransferase domain
MNALIEKLNEIRPVNEELIKCILHSIEIFEFEPNARIAYDNKAPTHLYYIKSGAVYASYSDEYGKNVVYGFRRDHDIIYDSNLLEERAWGFNIVSIEHTLVYGIEAARVNRIIRNNPIFYYYLSVLSSRNVLYSAIRSDILALTTAEARYNRFRQEFGVLADRLPPDLLNNYLHV